MFDIWKEELKNLIVVKYIIIFNFIDIKIYIVIDFL